MATAPAIHHWKAGDEWNADRMTEVSNAISWMLNPPMVHVKRALSDQSIAVTTWTSISFDTLVSSYDPYGMWNAATPTQITAQIPGWYMCEGVICMNQLSSNSRMQLGLWKHGTDVLLRWDQQTLPDAGGNSNMRKEASIFLNTGDTLELKAWYQFGTRTLTSTSGDHQGLRVRWVSN